MHFALGKTQCMRLGIFGGSFNPIHNGHLLAMQIFAWQMSLDRVLLTPTAVSFYKNTDLTAFEHRVQMCRLAAQGLNHVEVCEFEKSHRKGMPTFELIKAVKKPYPGSELFLLMGSDIFTRLLIWQNVDDIIASASICVLVRQLDEDQDAIERTSQAVRERGGFIHFLQVQALSVSSTQIRERQATGFPISSLVPPEIEAYIQTYNLYDRQNGKSPLVHR